MQQIASACCRGIGHRPGSLPPSRTSRPGYDAAITPRIARFFADYRDMRLGAFIVADGEIEDGGREDSWCTSAAARRDRSDGWASRARR